MVLLVITGCNNNQEIKIAKQEADKALIMNSEANKVCDQFYNLLKK